jgi:hypothetical protein
VPHINTLPDIYIYSRIIDVKNVSGLRSTFCQYTYKAAWLRVKDVVIQCVLFLQVHLRSHFIMNGVCVRWRGWIDLERLDGVGCLEYDEDKAQVLSQLIIYWAVFLKHFCSLPVGIAAL